MSTLVSPPTVTPEELLGMPDGVDFELVDGKLVERNMGWESSEIAARILGLLFILLKDHELGRLAGADGSYQCFPDAPGKVRKPDVSFIRSSRLPPTRTPKGHCPIAPDLAVEVISPGDLAYEVDEKVGEYMRAGVPLVWVVNPHARTVRIHRPRNAAGPSVSELEEGDTITGEDVIPGFSCGVRQFFASSALS